MYEKNGLEFSFMIEEDLKKITEYLSKENVCRYLFFGVLPEEEIRAYFMPVIQSMNKGEKKSFAMTIRKENTIIGHCGLDSIKSSKDNYLLGYMFNDEYWGQGYGTIAGEFLLNYAFNYLGAEKVTGDCYASNSASQRIMKNLGMKEEGCLRHQYFTNGSYDDQLLFGILKEEERSLL